MARGGQLTVVQGSRWAVALLALGLGTSLVLSPFLGLGLVLLAVVAGLVVLGLAEWAGAARSGAPWLRRGLGTGVLVLALLVVLWPGAGARALVLAVGAALVLSGGARVVTGWRGRTDVRAAALLEGAAAVLLGVVVLAWPDVSLVVASLLLGLRLVVVGVVELVGLLLGREGRPRHERSAGAPGRRPWWRRWLRTTAAATALVLALALVGLSAFLRGGTATVDDFYAAPAEVPDEPGALLRAEPFDRGLPEGAEAWRILYTTTRGDGSAALASGLVLVPEERGSDPLPVVTWAHGTTGVSPRCAPTLLADPLGSGAAPAVPQVVANGWAFVATDYTGLGTEGPHGYLVGEDAGRAVLDSVRAARQLDQVRLRDDTVVWGHSQGGGAALWAGVLAPSYAPDAGVGAVAAMAPASDLPALLGNLADLPGGSIFASYVVRGYADTYDDVRLEDYVRPGAQPLVEEVAERCLTDRATLVSVAESFVLGGDFWATDPASGPFGQRLAENVPSQRIDAPLLLAQGEADPLVLPAAQDGFARLQCEAGTTVDYRTYPGQDHVGVVSEGSPLVPELLAWTQDRLDGEVAQSTC